MHIIISNWPSRQILRQKLSTSNSDSNTSQLKIVKVSQRTRHYISHDKKVSSARAHLKFSEKGRCTNIFSFVPIYTPNILHGNIFITTGNCNNSSSSSIVVGSEDLCCHTWGTYSRRARDGV